MSEAITKRCPNPNCAWADFAGKPFPDDCPDCKGTGRIPDIEATQRAQLDAQRILIERFESQLRTKESENAELRGEVGRLTEEMARKDVAFDAHVAVTNQISANAIRVADENARLTAEVARLTEEMTRKDAAFGAHVAVTNQISANAIRVADEHTRLTAEVERLKGSNDANRPMAIGDVITLDDEVGMVAWVGPDYCRVVWTSEENTTEYVSTAMKGRAAWLAGCKS